MYQYHVLFGIYVNKCVYIKDFNFPFIPKENDVFYFKQHNIKINEVMYDIENNLFLVFALNPFNIMFKLNTTWRLVEENSEFFNWLKINEYNF